MHTGRLVVLLVGSEDEIDWLGRKFNKEFATS